VGAGAGLGELEEGTTIRAEGVDEGSAVTRPSFPMVTLCVPSSRVIVGLARCGCKRQGCKQKKEQERYCVGYHLIVVVGPHLVPFRIIHHAATDAKVLSSAQVGEMVVVCATRLGKWWLQ
jgi:hypothetical protein